MESFTKLKKIILKLEPNLSDDEKKEIIGRINFLSQKESIEPIIYELIKQFLLTDNDVLTKKSVNDYKRVMRREIRTIMRQVVDSERK